MPCFPANVPENAIVAQEQEEMFILREEEEEEEEEAIGTCFLQLCDHKTSRVCS